MQFFEKSARNFSFDQLLTPKKSLVFWRTCYLLNILIHLFLSIFCFYLFFNSEIKDEKDLHSYFYFIISTLLYLIQMIHNVEIFYKLLCVNNLTDVNASSYSVLFYMYMKWFHIFWSALGILGILAPLENEIDDNDFINGIKILIVSSVIIYCFPLLNLLITNCIMTIYIKKISGVYFKEHFDKKSTGCCICLGEYQDNDKIIVFRCNHYFHFECGQKWFRKDVVCPICRQSIIIFC